MHRSPPLLSVITVSSRIGARQGGTLVARGSLLRRFARANRRTLTTTSENASLSSSPPPSGNDKAMVLTRGDVPYGSREYLLVPPRTTLEEVGSHANLVLASLRAHRNILFGATTKHFDLSLATQTGPPLVQMAVVDAGSNGEQVQALATLHGLCDWVKAQLEQLEKDDSAESNDEENLLFQGMTDLELEAVRSIATGFPRPGHSVVGAGTFQDGQDAWIRWAQQFIKTTGGSPECALYTGQGAHLVQIEPLAGTSPEYLRSAGGAMARFFFL